MGNVLVWPNSNANSGTKSQRDPCNVKGNLMIYDSFLRRRSFNGNKSEMEI